MSILRKLSSKENHYSYDYLIFIGRFQIFHKAHLETISKSLKLSQYLIIVIGSYKVSLNPKNPWTANERKKWICDELSSKDLKRVRFIFLRDRLYNESLWKNDLINQVNKVIGPSIKRVALIGHKKDESSYYLEIFHGWSFFETGLQGHMHSTFLRADYFLRCDLRRIKENVPRRVYSYLLNFMKSPKFKLIKKEYQDLSKSKIDKTNYDLILCQNHVLLEVKKGFKRFSLPSLNKVSQENQAGPFQEKSKLKRLKKIKTKTYAYSILKSKYKNKVTFSSLALNLLPKLEKKFVWMNFEELMTCEDRFENNHYQIISNLVFQNLH